MGRRAERQQATQQQSEGTEQPRRTLPTGKSGLPTHDAARPKQYQGTARGPASIRAQGWSCQERVANGQIFAAGRRGRDRSAYGRRHRALAMCRSQSGQVATGMRYLWEKHRLARHCIGKVPSAGAADRASARDAARREALTRGSRRIVRRMTSFNCGPRAPHELSMRDSGRGWRRGRHRRLRCPASASGRSRRP
jgi:hypothetical protein